MKNPAIAEKTAPVMTASGSGKCATCANQMQVYAPIAIKPRLAERKLAGYAADDIHADCHDRVYSREREYLRGIGVDHAKLDKEAGDENRGKGDGAEDQEILRSFRKAHTLTRTFVPMIPVGFTSRITMSIEKDIASANWDEMKPLVMVSATPRI